MDNARLISDKVSYTARTDTCGSLRPEHVGKHVHLCGWLQFQRLSGKIIVLRDWQGITQLVINKVQHDRISLM